jgi:quercetin dioxygenase-like cupin family protein
VQTRWGDERSGGNVVTGIVDLAAGDGPGPVWGTASHDLNATLLVWPRGGGTPEHVNAERDVLVVVLDGSGTVTVDGVPSAIGAHQAVLIDRGASRRLEAGPDGIRYLSVHLRRAGLQVAPAPATG